MQLTVTQLSCMRQQKYLFENISFELRAGEILLVEGANGSGKSSLLRLLTGLSMPDNGHILWKQQNIFSDVFTYRAQLHYVGHSNGIKLGLTVAENIKLMAQLSSTTCSTEKMELILSQLNLLSLQQQLTQHLSAGQKRRVALAKLFLFPKSLWIIDEAFTALDVAAQTFFLMQLDLHLQQDRIAIMSSHHALSLKNIMSMQKIKLGT